jgi:hypothetical protein
MRPAQCTVPTVLAEGRGSQPKPANKMTLLCHSIYQLIKGVLIQFSIASSSIT